MAVFSLDRIVLYVSFCLLFLHVIFLRLIVCIMCTYRICIVHTSGVYLFVHFLNCVAFHHWSIRGADVWAHFQLWRLWPAQLHLSRLLLYFSSAVTLEYHRWVLKDEHLSLCHDARLYSKVVLLIFIAKGSIWESVFLHRCLHTFLNFALWWDTFSVI